MKAEKKKIGLIIIAIIIIAGIAMVALKGFKVSLYLTEHQTLKYKFDVSFEKKDIKDICAEVFGEKEYDVRTVEVFNDSVYIISSSITEEEKDNLVKKLSSLYQEEKTNENEESNENSEESSNENEVSDKYEFYKDSNVRIRDLVKPYKLPVIISAVIILIYVMIRYKLLKVDSVLKKTFLLVFEEVIVLLALLSIVAILRIPLDTWVLPSLMFLCLAYMVIKFETEDKV